MWSTQTRSGCSGRGSLTKLNCRVIQVCRRLLCYVLFEDFGDSNRCRGSGEHSEDDGALCLLQDVHSFGMSHTLQAVAVHSDDLISTLQPAVLYCCPLQGMWIVPLARGQRRKTNCKSLPYINVITQNLDFDS